MNTSDCKVMFSKNSDEWATPQTFFDEINKEFCFNLDPCSTDENHKCDKYYTITDNGLEKSWGGTEYFVTHHILKLKSGLQRLFMKPGMITH
jgi:site-specific DNA-methyltransferase (adenine-specific)